MDTACVGMQVRVNSRRLEHRGQLRHARSMHALFLAQLHFLKGQVDRPPDGLVGERSTMKGKNDSDDAGRKRAGSTQAAGCSRMATSPM
jgi:hypothetical protein